MKIQIWHYRFRITLPGEDKRSLVDDHIAIEGGINREKIIAQVKDVLNIPEQNKVEIEFCYQRHIADLPVGHVIVQTSETSNEELAS